MLSPLGLLGYLRFCKLCSKSHWKASRSFNFALLFYSLLYFFYDDVYNDVNDDDDDNDDVNTFL